MSTTKRSIESKSKFLSSLSKRGGIETKKKKTDSKKVTTKSKKSLITSRSKNITKPKHSFEFGRNQLFNEIYKTTDYRDLIKDKKEEQREPQKLILTSTNKDFPVTEAIKDLNRDLYGPTTATYTKSSEKRNVISPTTNRPLPGSGQLDHIVSVDAIRALIKREELLPTDKQLKEVFTSPKITQVLSRQENIDKSAKRLWEYSKETGWGTTERPQTFNPEGQATRYAEAMTEAARILGAEGGMTRHDQEAYSRLKGGKLPDDIHLKHSAIKNKAIRGFPKYPAVGEKENQDELPALQKDSPFPATPATPKSNIKIQPVTKEKPTPSITPALSSYSGTNVIADRLKKNQKSAGKSLITNTDGGYSEAELIAIHKKKPAKKKAKEETEAQKRGRLAGEAAAKSLTKRAESAIAERNVAYQKPFKRKGVELPFIKITG